MPSVAAQIKHTLTGAQILTTILQEEGVDIHRQERFYGKFQRALTLPAPVAADKVKANYKDGVLTITLPKTEEAKPKQIDVSVN